MKRYETARLKMKKLPNDVEIPYVGTFIYDEIPESDGDLWVISQYGDRLDLMAHQYYGDSGLWWYLAKANKLKFMVIPTGTSLRIPGTTSHAKGK